MLQRDEIWVGILYGILIPVVFFLVLYNLFSLLEINGAASGIGFSENFRERTLAIVAIAFNLFILSRFRKRRWEKAMRGVVIATSLLAITWLMVYGVKLF
ncbi:MAG: hypothetical protein JNN28_18155 [Saprospiraceae bacterium]|nr:hypothetical protein [Saprospiraceae bacterium]